MDRTRVIFRLAKAAAEGNGKWILICRHGEFPERVDTNEVRTLWFKQQPQQMRQSCCHMRHFASVKGLHVQQRYLCHTPTYRLLALHDDQFC